MASLATLWRLWTRPRPRTWHEAYAHAPTSPPMTDWQKSTTYLNGRVEYEAERLTRLEQRLARLERRHAEAHRG